MFEFEEGIRDAEFIVGRTGDPNLTRSGGYIDTSVALQSGTPLGRRTSDEKLAPWAPSDTDGTQHLVGLLLLNLHVEGPGIPTKRVAYVSGGPQAVTDLDGRIPLPAGVTRAELAAALIAIGITLID